ncbi:MAG TPA: hypothetical protein VGI39_04725 [Polyangiaceae bacterium]
MPDSDPRNLQRIQCVDRGTRFALGVLAMGHPRRVIPAETYLVTRRCYQRTFRLRPNPETNRIFMYCLALAMAKTGVVLHAACVMSNHHHLVVTDVRGVLPEFLRELHRLTAKALNASQGQWENLWSAERCSAVRLVTDDDVIDKIAYVVSNPVSAGLVERPEEWPGFMAWDTRGIQVARPMAYFREEGVCAPVLFLEVQPPSLRDRLVLSADEWSARVRRAIADKVGEAHALFAKERRRFLGRRAVLATSFVDKARSYEQRRSVFPVFAACLAAVRDRLRRVEQHFRATYRQALDAWRAGDRAIEFPFGTWSMRVLHSAAVGPPIDLWGEGIATLQEAWRAEVEIAG